MRFYRPMLLFVLLAAAAACGDDKKQDGADHKQQQEVEKQYMCPMKCTAPSSSPGKCPKCGMELEEVIPA